MAGRRASVTALTVRARPRQPLALGGWAQGQRMRAAGMMSGTEVSTGAHGVNEEGTSA